MKKILLPLLFSLGIVGTAQACNPATGYDYKALVLATGLNQPELVQKLTTDYCYNLDTFDFGRINTSHPAFFSPTPVFMNYYLKVGRNLADFKEYASGLDVLSFILITPYAAKYESSQEEKEEAIALAKKYDPNASVDWFKNPYQTIDNNPEKFKEANVWMNHQMILEQLLPLYKNILTMPKDSNGNGPVEFAVLTNEAHVFETLTQNQMYNYYQFNKDGFTLFHLAFAKKNWSGDETKFKINEERINNILMNNFRPNRIEYLNIGNVSFNAFMETMKENNLDLYQKITGKQKALNAYPKDIENVDSVRKNNKTFYEDTLDYIKAYH